MNNKYTFNNFIKDLRNKREFDIIVYNQKYGISWFKGGRISFAKYGDESFCKCYDSVEEFERDACIGEDLLRMIWDEVEVEIMY